MKRKIVGILVVTLLIAAAVLPVVGTMNVENNQEVEKFIQPINPPKPSKLPLLPPFLLELFNGDWNYWSNSPHMFAIPEGNVGIGTSNPTSELEVVGNVEADSFTINGNPIGTSTDSYWSEGEEGNIYYDGGDVGIGTSNPTSELEVVGNVEADSFTINGNPIGTSSDSYTFNPQNIVPSQVRGLVYYDANDDELYVWDGNIWQPLTGGGGADKDWLPQTAINTDDIYHMGRVGIGGIYPSRALDVVGGMIIRNTDGVNVLEISRYPTHANIATGWFGGGGPVADLSFSTAGVSNEKMRIKTNGNVGIGTTDPCSRLHVNGPVATAITTVVGGTDWNHAYEITSDDSVIFASTAAGDPNGWVKLPLAADCPGREYTIKNVGGSGTVWLGFTDLDLIDPADAQYGLNAWDSVTVVSNGVNRWYITANYDYS